VIVEFLGVPGVGKSVISRRLAVRIESEGIAVSEPTYSISHERTDLSRLAIKLLLAATSLLRHPARGLIALRAVHESGQGGVANSLRGWMNLLFVEGVIERAARQPALHLLDQGYFQALASLHLGAENPDALRPVEALGPISEQVEHVICVEAETETVMRRIQGRARKGRLDYAALEGNLEQMLERASNSIGRAKQLAANGMHGPIRVQVVSGEDPVEKDIDTVADQLVVLYRSSR
jgi:thymidylate kinase